MYTNFAARSARASANTRPSPRGNSELARHGATRQSAAVALELVQYANEGPPIVAKTRRRAVDAYACACDDQPKLSKIARTLPGVLRDA